MSRQTKIINMSLPLPLWREVDKLAKKEEISRSEILKDSLSQYIKAKKRWQIIRKWGEEASIKFKIETEKDLENIIHEFRKEKKQRTSE
ncbi:ribbon-helix-helix protein, CopG family [Candidatus Desantisbacteria bacterium]|nr:ribbon-helix-helix protein, CopG family [Candidatus Desantisbacteria bacterium]